MGQKQLNNTLGEDWEKMWRVNEAEMTVYWETNWGPWKREEKGRKEGGWGWGSGRKDEMRDEDDHQG